MTTYAEQAKQARLKLLTIEQGHFNISQTTRKLLKRNAELLDTLARVEAVVKVVEIEFDGNDDWVNGRNDLRGEILEALEGGYE